MGVFLARRSVQHLVLFCDFFLIDILDKTGTILLFIKSLLESACDSIIETCNNISKDYRMVADQLEEEVKEAKKQVRVSLSCVESFWC
jgi:hypothetical protein